MFIHGFLTCPLAQGWGKSHFRRELAAIAIGMLHRSAPAFSSLHNFALYRQRKSRANHEEKNKA
ncbi:MAG: hypothetical protein QM501_12120, partial [Gimesia sp.]